MLPRRTEDSETHERVECSIIYWNLCVLIFNCKIKTENSVVPMWAMSQRAPPSPMQFLLKNPEIHASYINILSSISCKEVIDLSLYKFHTFKHLENILYVIIILNIFYKINIHKYTPSFSITYILFSAVFLCLNIHHYLNEQNIKHIAKTIFLLCKTRIFSIWFKLWKYKICLPLQLICNFLKILISTEKRINSHFHNGKSSQF